MSHSYKYSALCRSIAGVIVPLALSSCGGGGAAVDPGTNTPPGGAPETPGTPGAAPGANVVTTVGASFSPAAITIAQGASVTWQIAEVTHNVTFSASKPAGGDVPNTAAGVSATRAFATPGTYPYQCTLHSGMNGSVIVQGSTAPVFTSVVATPGTPAINVGSTTQLSASARDQNGSAMSGLPAPTWTSSSNAVATVNASGTVTGVAAGTATVTATIASGGTTRSGTATVTVTAATGGNVVVRTPDKTFSPRTVTIGTGGSVTWQISEDRHNVTFGALKPAGGDVPGIDPGNAATRSFATEGTYNYQCTLHSGMTGSVIVTSGGSTPTPPTNPDPGTIVEATPSRFSPERVEIAPGGVVTWAISGGTFGIVFEDDAPDGGNIPDSAPGSRVSRTFSVEGDYDYYSSRNPDVKGRIRVR